MIRKLLAALAILAMLAYLSDSDYSAEDADAGNYCEMVRAGYWPDYRGELRYCPESVATLPPGVRPNRGETDIAR